VRLSGTLLQSIQTVGRNVPVSIVFRDSDLTAELVANLGHVGRLTLLRNPNLHAKCFFNEQTMVLTSMNLSGDAEPGNWEMGVLIDRELDASLYQSAFDEVIKITGMSDIIGLRQKGPA
jgi:phosphatidylserine/phosphatidylglycerophosphate/cardiolipin synthase-like enzyme